MQLFLKIREQIQKYRKIIVIGSLSILVSLCLVSAGYIILRDKEVTYLNPRYALVQAKNGAYVREEPQPKAHLLIIIKRDSIVQALAETNDSDEVRNIGTAKWIRVKTRSGHAGWIFGKSLNFIRHDIAKTNIERDIAKFEDKIKPLIFRAAANRIRTSKIHSWSRIIDIRISSPLVPKTSASYDVEVTALMLGNIFGMNKYEVKCLVNLQLEIDENLLSHSSIRVRQTDIISDRQVYGLEPKDAVHLLANMPLKSFFK